MLILLYNLSQRSLTRNKIITNVMNIRSVALPGRGTKT